MGSGLFQNMTKEENNIIISQNYDKVARVPVRFTDKDVWLMQNQLTFDIQDLYIKCR